MGYFAEDVPEGMRYGIQILPSQWTFDDEIWMP